MSIALPLNKQKKCSTLVRKWTQRCDSRRLQYAILYTLFLLLTTCLLTLLLCRKERNSIKRQEMGGSSYIECRMQSVKADRKEQKWWCRCTHTHTHTYLVCIDAISSVLKWLELCVCHGMHRKCKITRTFLFAFLFIVQFAKIHASASASARQWHYVRHVTLLSHPFT